jgi:hypothetical protein
MFVNGHHQFGTSFGEMQLEQFAVGPMSQLLPDGQLDRVSDEMNAGITKSQKETAGMGAGKAAHLFRRHCRASGRRLAIDVATSRPQSVERRRVVWREPAIAQRGTCT